MVYFKRLKSSGFVSLEAFKMYYVMRTFAPSLHRKSTDFLIGMVVHFVLQYIAACVCTILHYINFL